MALLKPVFEVQITNINAKGESVGLYKVKAVSQITVNLSAEKPCDTAEIRIPTSKKPMIKQKDDNGNVKEMELISPKDKIEIKFGYLGEKADLVTVFSGYVSWVSPEAPLVIKAEDGFRAAKHNWISGEFGSDTKPVWYSDIAKEILSEADLNAYIPTPRTMGDWQSTGLQLNKQTIAQAMAKLSQDTEWIHFYLPETNEVYFGPRFPYQRGYLPRGVGKAQRLLYRIGSGRQKSIALEGSQALSAWGNVISASGLKFQSQKPYRRVICNLVDVRFSSKSVEGTAELPASEECGEQEISFTAHYHFKESKAANEAEARRRAKEKLAYLNSSQYSGSFTTFGNPMLRHSQIFKLESAEHPGKIDGYYEAKSISFNYSPSGGFRMTVDVAKPPDAL